MRSFSSLGAWIILFVLTLCSSSHVAAASDYSLDWDAIACGGGVSTAGHYTLVDIVGQPDAGTAASEALRWEAGFLPGLNLQPAGNSADWVFDEDTLLKAILTGLDWDGDRLTYTLDIPPAHGEIELSADGTFTFTPSPNYYGTDSFTFKVNDGEFDSPSATATLTINPVNDPPTVGCSPAEQTVQYSDLITDVTVSATDVDSPGYALTTATQWNKDGGAFTAGLPDGLVLALSTTTGGGRAWALFGTAQVAPGTYLIHIAVTDDQDGVGSTELTLHVTPEDAWADYTGALFVSTASPSSSLATVTLSATIKDITAVPDDPAYDACAGDIRNATVAFINLENNTIIAQGVPVGLVSPSDPKTGTATCDWKVDIGKEDSTSTTVGIVVNRRYTRNASEDNTVVTISKPLASDFITGGGYLVIEQSAGLCAGEPGRKANFGFNVKYNKSGKSLQGRINTIVRSDGRVYQAKGNVMSSLSILGNQATFNGKASIIDITDPLLPISIDGNATLQVVMTDNGDPGWADTIAITVWNKNGGLWFASNWDGTRTVEQLLGGGNLVVRSGGKLSLAGLPALESTADEWFLLTIERLIDLPVDDVTCPFVLRFPVIPITNYALEWSSDLVTWTHLTTVMSFTDAVEYFDEADSPADCQFYRVRAGGHNSVQFPNPNPSEP
jgi:hypothetical protein